MNYRLEISKLAQRHMNRLPDRVTKRINQRFEAIAANPYAGARKLSTDPAFRARVGDYRIIYDIDDRGRTITILGVLHRREAYR